MSGSRNKLEQILELLLNENSKKAEELLHEYVVSKAREEYERVLDEADEEEEWEDDLDDYEDEIEQNEEVFETDDDLEDGEVIDQTGDFEDEVVVDDDPDEEDDHHADVGGQEDFENRVDDLESELEELRAEFEALMNDDEEGADDEEFDDEDEEGDEEEFSLDDEVDSDEELEEGTNFSQKTSEQPVTGGKTKNSDADNEESPYTKAPEPTGVDSQGEPVKTKDGGEGKKDHGGSVKNDSSVNNMKVKPKSHGSKYGSGAKASE